MAAPIWDRFRERLGDWLPSNKHSVCVIICSCGKEHRCVRHERHRMFSCGACGRPLFVLPKSPLPTPAPNSP